MSLETVGEGLTQAGLSLGTPRVIRVETFLPA